MIDTENIYMNHIISQLFEKLSMIESKINEMQEHTNSPYVNGIDGLAKYLGIGETLAQDLKNRKEIPCSQRGRQIWFRKSDIERFMQQNRM